MLAWVGSSITKLPGFRPKVTLKKELVIRNPDKTFICFMKIIISKYKEIKFWYKSWDLPTSSTSGNEKKKNYININIKC